MDTKKSSSKVDLTRTTDFSLKSQWSGLYTIKRKNINIFFKNIFLESHFLG